MKIEENKNQDLQSNLLSLCFHQLRNNMTILYSNAELIEMKTVNFDPAISASICSNTKRIKAEVDQIMGLMSYILDLGKQEVFETNKNIQAVDLSTFLEHIILIYFNEDSTKRKINFKVNGIQKNVFTDKLLLTQIIIDLMSNAFKYSEGHKDPMLIISYLEKEITIEVVDFGIGIPETEKQTLFTPFYRCSNVNGIQGSGLGLFISKKFIEILKGSLVLESREHVGTTIKLTFPYE
ncbi:HAMP domain-containing sensor histidine kinase [Flavobacterium sp. KS-LB2]|jgi:signal transduction histidine kinase|uniref:sensor histidine kinase n=1 Tax=Flavobacterium sp. KS-LB2 TaxID=3120525 RepID=UPI0030D3EB3D